MNGEMVRNKMCAKEEPKAPPEKHPLRESIPGRKSVEPPEPWPEPPRPKPSPPEKSQ